MELAEPPWKECEWPSGPGREVPGDKDSIRGRTGDWRSVFNMADAFVQDIVRKVRGILSPVGLESYPFKVSIFFNKPHNTFIRGCFVDG